MRFMALLFVQHILTHVCLKKVSFTSIDEFSFWLVKELQIQSAALEFEISLKAVSVLRYITDHTHRYGSVWAEWGLGMRIWHQYKRIDLKTFQETKINHCIAFLWLLWLVTRSVRYFQRVPIIHQLCCLYSQRDNLKMLSQFPETM